MTAITHHATPLQIPLSQLILSPRNARQTSPKAINELAALLDSQGQLQNLVVTAEMTDNAPTGRYEVIAGGRRWRAMQLLVQQGRWQPDHLVDVKVRDSEEAEEASLAENSGREAMHPADEFEAFKRLIDAGAAIEDVAARFGVSPLVVQRRLKLANVSPKLIQTYRDGEASLEQLMALAITDDHKAQERIWKDAPRWERTPERLRAKLAKGEVEVRASKMAKFVGMEAYEAAGGRVTRDLFSDAGNGFLSDAELLNRLATEKLQAAADTVRSEGWSWVEIDPDFDRYQLYRYSRINATTLDLTKDQKAQSKVLEKEKSDIADRLEQLEEEDNYGDDHDALTERAEAIDSELQAIEQSRMQWDADTKQTAGAIVSVSDAGVLQIFRGLAKQQSSTSTAQAKKKVKPAIPESLARRLTAHRTAALQLQLIEQPHIALALLVHKLVLSASARAAYETAGKSAVRISMENSMDPLPSIADDLKATPLWKKLQATRTGILKGLPKSNNDLLQHLLKQPQQDLLQLLALCTATALYAVAGSEGPTAADAVAEAVDLDMSQWWSASGASYLQHVPKAKAIEAVEAAVGKKDATALSTMKKDAAIAAAEEKLAGTGWLPKILQGKKAPAKKAEKPARKAAAAPAGRIPVRYRDENGNAWTGRGKRPGWVEAALASGKTLEELLVPDALEAA